MKNLSVDNLVELMIECEKENPIDFFDLPVDEKHCRYLVASHALELFSLINDPRERYKRSNYIESKVYGY